MRKKLLALLICAQMVLSAMLPIFPTVTGSEGADASTGGAPTVSVEPSGTTVESIFPASKLFWKSYREYLLEQVQAAKANPAAFNGYEISFLSAWGGILCRSGFEESDEEIYLDLDFESSETVGDVFGAQDAKLVIDGFHYEEETQYLWYKLKAAEGYELPEALASHPYVLYMECEALEDGRFDEYPPTFNIGKLQAIFNSLDDVTVKKQPVMATKEASVSIANLPAVFEVTPVYGINGEGLLAWDYFHIGNIAAAYTEYQYVDAVSVVLIPAETTKVYEEMLNAEDTYAYYEALRGASQEVLEQLSDRHKAELDICIEALMAKEQVKYETAASFNGTELPVSVVGLLPEGVTLQAQVVSGEEALAEGFDLESASDALVALDIKLIHDADGTEWQPKEGRRVAVSIGMSALGYSEGSIFRLQHKHGESIDDYKLAVMEDEFLTVYTSGFSIYVVSESKVEAPNNATAINQTQTLEVGQEIVYYQRSSNSGGGGISGWPGMGGGNTSNGNGTWRVNDPSGALYYTVYSQSNVDKDGIRVPWIKIDALKAATGITISYYTTSANVATEDQFTINVVAPKAQANVNNGRRLYIKDDVNKTGRIIAALVDTNGNELSLDGAAFSWTRKSKNTNFINPDVYGDNYASVNIARDHGGLVESNKDEDGYIPTVYTVKAVLSDGTELTADYTVYYQSEIINSDFEFPAGGTGDNNYVFFPNGWDQLYWKTTAPGTTDKISQDVEYGNPNGTGTGFGVPQAASGIQFAELNAEAFGALYQDIISVPGEDIEWSFSHAPRQTQDWAQDRRDFTNAMFIVIGATESAQKLGHDDLDSLGVAAKNAGKNNQNFLKGLDFVTVTYKDAEYYVWYHDAGIVPQGNAGDAYSKENNYGWTPLEGSYHTPEGQYRTRLFFVSEKNNYNPNAGNLIDNARGGQYKKYLVEYWLGEPKVDHLGAEEIIYTKHADQDETGEALVYSTISLEKLNTLIGTGEYLHKILINGKNYPYSIRYEKTESGGQGSQRVLYVQKYPFGTGMHYTQEKYPDYDIVVQVYLRKVVISVEKELIFPAAMTEEQKLSVIQQWGYKADIDVVSVGKYEEGGSGGTGNTGASDNYHFSETGTAVITGRDNYGNYRAGYSVEQFPEIGYMYQVTEGATTALPGLKLAQTDYRVDIFIHGALDPTHSYTSKAGEDEVHFPMDENHNFAEVYVKNTYEETETIIHYVAVGNGKVKFVGDDDGVFEDKPTETLKFYSGKSVGAAIHPGNGATFMGWFKDPECTDPITAADGAYNEQDHSFRPNANLINTNEITFYAKFETGSIEIQRSNGLPGETFVYHVQSTDSKVDFYVTVRCGDDGVGSVAVLEVPLGKTYNVTECNNWSWRHEGKTLSGTNGDSKEKRKLTFKFDSSVKDNQWINGYGEPQSNVY